MSHSDEQLKQMLKQDITQPINNWNTHPPPGDTAVQSGVRQFATGATRSSDEGKIDYEGFISIPAWHSYGLYMNKHRLQPDGTLRDSNNWKKGMPLTGDGSYIKALFRHVVELVGLMAGFTAERILRELPKATHDERLVDTACAVLFNAQGFLHELVESKRMVPAAPPAVGWSTGKDR